jgi:hypothetical protein
MRKTHARSRAQITQVWKQGISALIRAWNEPVNEGDPT